MCVCEAIRPTDGCKSIDLLLFSSTCRLSKGGKVLLGGNRWADFKCLKAGRSESLSGCQTARCSGSLCGQLSKSDKKSANTERDDGETQTEMRDKTRQDGATSGPFPNKQKLPFFPPLTYQFKPLGCDRKRNGPEGRRDLKGRGKSDARVSVSVSSSGSAALFLAVEAEMESDCCHCPMVVFLIKKSLRSDTPPGV